jgi:hypothetical protein
MMDDSFWPILGTTGLFITCIFLFIGLAIAVLLLWIFGACLVDAFKKSEAEFPERTLWRILLISSAFVGLIWLSSLVYYFMYKPKLDFWRN